MLLVTNSDWALNRAGNHPGAGRAYKLRYHRYFFRALPFGLSRVAGIRSNRAQARKQTKHSETAIIGRVALAGERDNRHPNSVHGQGLQRPLLHAF
jgi:hypothetical protein